MQTILLFVLGILTEFGDFADRAQFSEEGRRSLAAVSAIYDLLTEGNGANGVILVDNEILVDRFEKLCDFKRFICRMDDAHDLWPRLSWRDPAEPGYCS